MTMTRQTYQWYRLWWLFALGVLLFAAPKPAAAQASELQPVATFTPLHCITLADGGSYYLTETRQLAAGIPEQVSIAPKGQFHLDAIFTPPLKPSQRVLLSGSETGSSFVVDDILTLEVIPGDQSRSWDFRSSDWMQIIPIEQPEEITDLFLPDRYHMITVTMQDVLTPNYRTSELWLLTYSPCDWPTVTPTVTSMATQMKTPLPPTATATATLTPVASMTVTVATTLPASRQNGVMTEESSNPPIRSLRLWLLSLTAIGTLLSAYALLRMKLHRLFPSFERCRSYFDGFLLKLYTKWQEIKAIIQAQMKE